MDSEPLPKKIISTVQFYNQTRFRPGFFVSGYIEIRGNSCMNKLYYARIEIDGHGCTNELY